jgi:hypothetical protein
LICSIVRPPFHKPLQSATARVAAWDAAFLRGVGVPPGEKPGFGFATAVFARGGLSWALIIFIPQRMSATQIQTAILIRYIYTSK